MSLNWCRLQPSCLPAASRVGRNLAKRQFRLALEKSRLKASLNQAQLEALRARLHPHLLLNSLPNISVLTKQDPETASRMLTVLEISCARCCEATPSPKAPCAMKST
jgi:hypothetical protein